MLDWLAQVFEKFWDYIRPWEIVDPFESGVLVRLGKYNKKLEAGSFTWKVPFIDYVYTAIITPDTMNTAPITLTTTDGKTVSIGAVIEFEINDIYKYTLCTNEPRSNMHDIILGAISDEIEDREWEEIRKKTTRNAVLRKISKKAEEMGIKIIDFYFTDKCVVRPFKIFRDN